MELLRGGIEVVKLKTSLTSRVATYGAFATRLFDEFPLYSSSSRLPDPLGPGDAFDQGGSLAAELGAALALPGLAGGGDLGLEAALLEQEEVELHRLGARRARRRRG